MAATLSRQSAAAAFDKILILPLLAVLGAGAVALVVGPEMLTVAIFGMGGALVVGVRPQWGVAAILFLLMVQYGSRRYEREGVAGGLSSLLPQGSGLMTPNNLLGILLTLLIVYYVYLDGDWSFLKSPIVQLVLAITAVLVLSGSMSGISASDQAAIGLEASTAQDPIRVLISRSLFLVFFVFFIRTPRDLRMIVMLFVALAVMTAWSGSGSAVTGEGQLNSGAYRAGGLDVLIQSSKNPNRLAMIATLGLVYIWEYSQAHQLRRWKRLLALAGVSLMVVTVFLTASRGGLIGLVVAGMALFVHSRGGSGRWLYGLALAVICAMLIQEVVPEQSWERITNIPGISKDDNAGQGEGSTERRRYTYEIGLQMWKKAPIVGVGPGNWSYVRFLTDPLRSIGVAHNSFLAELVEGGVVTLTLYMGLFYMALRDLLRCERQADIVERAKREGLDWILSGTRICLIAFLVFSLFSDLWDLVFSYFLLGASAVLARRYLPTRAAGMSLARPVTVG